MQLDKIYQQIVKNVTVKWKVENHAKSVAASFTYDDLATQDEDRNTEIQWTVETDFRGYRQQLRGQVLTEHTADWKKSAEARMNKSKNLNCWNYESPNHRAYQCLKPLRPEVRDRLEAKH